MRKGKIVLIKSKHPAKGPTSDPSYARQGDIVRNKAGDLFVVTARRMVWLAYDTVHPTVTRHVAMTYLKPKGEGLGYDPDSKSIKVQTDTMKRRGWKRLTEKVI